MTLLADQEISDLQNNTRNLIEPFDPKMVQPASYELHLGEGIVEMKSDKEMKEDIDEVYIPLDVTNKEECEKAFQQRTVAYSRGFLLLPGDFCLVTTEEKVWLPDNVAARVEGKSSLGRVGLAIHTTAGWIDPGFKGNITLELSNLSKRTLELTVGMKIAQLAFFQMSGPAVRPYGHSDLGSAYQNQDGVTGSSGTRG